MGLTNGDARSSDCVRALKLFLGVGLCKDMAESCCGQNERSLSFQPLRDLVRVSRQVWEYVIT